MRCCLAKDSGTTVLVSGACGGVAAHAVTEESLALARADTQGSLAMEINRACRLSCK